MILPIWVQRTRASASSPWGWCQMCSTNMTRQPTNKNSSCRRRNHHPCLAFDTDLLRCVVLFPSPLSAQVTGFDSLHLISCMCQPLRFSCAFVAFICPVFLVAFSLFAVGRKKVSIIQMPRIAAAVTRRKSEKQKS